MRRIVFHIGLAKTGTTAFQHFCQRHRRFLQHHGVLYPRRHRGRSFNHSPMVASYIAHRPEGPTVAVRWAPRSDAVRLLRAEIDASDEPVALISSEHFSMHFDRSEALELAADFADYECIVVIVLRDVHARFLSAYNTHVTAGGCLPIEDYARSVLIPGTRYMSACETVRIWQEAFGRDRVRIVDYDGPPDIVAAILGVCGIGGPLPPAARNRRRVSLDADTIEALRSANAVIAARQAKPATQSLAVWAQLSFFSILCRRKLSRSSSKPRGWTISETTLRALDGIAATDRQWIEETYAVKLRGDNTRGRIRIGDLSAPDPEAMRRTEALVDGVTRGLWFPSQALVKLWDRLAPARSSNET